MQHFLFYQMIARTTIVLLMTVSMLSLIQGVAMAQPVPNQTVVIPLIDRYMIPPHYNILNFPSTNSTSCESWTNTEGDEDGRSVTRVQQCHTESQQPQSQQPKTDPLLSQLLSNY